MNRRDEQERISKMEEALAWAIFFLLVALVIVSVEAVLHRLDPPAPEQRLGQVELRPSSPPATNATDLGDLDIPGEYAATHGPTPWPKNGARR